jgi:hemolysin III
MNASISSQNRYSRREELANSLIHGTGAALSIAALAMLATMAGFSGDPWRVVSFSIYGSCLLLLYLASTFYHAFRSPRLKQLFRVFDHTAIFLLIAGTYTPITLVILRGGWGWTLFGLIWGFAAAGIVLEVFFLDRIRWLTITTYVGMGWLVIIALKPLIEVMPLGALLWIGAGGVAYTTGVIFYVWKKLPFNHAIWHLFVLGGSSCHFIAFWLYIV